MHDIAVLGGGPAGMAAATEAARAGARTVLLEESPQPGGQVFRAPAFDGPRDADRRAGDRLRAALAESGAEVLAGRRVWGLGGGPLVAEGAGPFTVSALGAEVTARALILATGTHERVIPFPGWTLPGVLGLAAATILLKAQGVLPGRRVVVAGVGPLLYAVAAKILAAGGRVVALVDAATTSEWARALPALAARPDVLARGLIWRARIAAAGVPVLTGARVTEATGDAVLSAVRVNGRLMEADALCIGHGLVPATEASRTYRCAHVHDPGLGGWVPVLDAGRRTSVPFLYAAGDGAGLRGAAAAPASGRLAARAALRDLGFAPKGSDPAGAFARAARAGAVMAGMMALRPALIEAIPATTVVCRCEGVTRAEIDAAADAGAGTMNQLKQFTRCGMGPCQGRMCGEAASALLASRRNVPVAAVGFTTGRIPLRPVPMDAILGDFDYADIPVPAPAPL
ncbi:NAD(P)/FAD-dependent oxidoreductase [Humitalea sp. 24SJ18S-53]|uniref:FAD/NAD(P)-dependent oxidoreductase n=1 Tax=Humitalea sp. 24SJ18S-53 TaxID=3422307 RepID=UPI003D67F5D7